jgi:hypothetical protein
MTEIPIVCQFHIFPPDFDGIPEYPSTTFSRARDEGWRTTTDRLFSQDGKEMWVCPECVERLRNRYYIERHRCLEDEACRHSRCVANLDANYHNNLHDLQMRNAMERENIERRYRRRLESLG